MANKAIKTEMNGTMGGRYMTRAEAKKGSKKARRRNDGRAIREQAPPGYTRAPALLARSGQRATCRATERLLEQLSPRLALTRAIGRGSFGRHARSA